MVDGIAKFKVEKMKVLALTLKAAAGGVARENLAVTKTPIEAADIAKTIAINVTCYGVSLEDLNLYQKFLSMY